jgi:lipopolysaccharide/colanic/teichoic acid biosynthesis glycosyltransferase
MRLTPISSILARVSPIHQPLPTSRRGLLAREESPHFSGRLAHSDRPRTLRGKRAFDLSAALALLCVAAPVLTLIAVLIKLDSRGPALYSQERVGIDRRRFPRRRTQRPVAADGRNGDRRVHPAAGRPFHILKFRTMIPGAEDECGPTWAAPNDPRVTRVGRLLRVTRLDELPQLWNVVQGQMSLVGPRPERPHFVNQFADQIPGYRARLEALPGITGLAQVELAYDRSEDDVRQKLHYDLEYLRRASVLEDLHILLRTVWVMVTGRGAA